MTERPILFNADMVRAILAGRKTQTRRPCEIPKGWEPWVKDGKIVLGKIMDDDSPKKGRFGVLVREPFDTEKGLYAYDVIPCPFGQPGDILWVRETWTNEHPDKDGSEVADGHTLYRADGVDYADSDGFTVPSEQIRWRPSIHMPRWAARIFLRVKSVRIEHAKDIIGDEDALKSEGMDYVQYIGKRYVGDLPLIYRFSGAMDAIYGDGFFGSNPWLWVVEFERVQESEVRS